MSLCANMWSNASINICLFLDAEKPIFLENILIHSVRSSPCRQLGRYNPNCPALRSQSIYPSDLWAGSKAPLIIFQRERVSVVTFSGQCKVKYVFTCFPTFSQVSRLPVPSSGNQRHCSYTNVKKDWILAFLTLIPLLFNNCKITPIKSCHSFDLLLPMSVISVFKERLYTTHSSSPYVSYAREFAAT